MARKNPPIIKAVIRGGESLDTSDKPMGDKQSSPMVITPYEAISHIEPAFMLNPLVAKTAPTITNADKAVITKPMAILVGVLGSFFRRLKKPKIPTIKGVSTTTQNGLMDWYNSVEYNFKLLPFSGIWSPGRVEKYFLDFYNPNKTFWA